MIEVEEKSLSTSEVMCNGTEMVRAMETERASEQDFVYDVYAIDEDDLKDDSEAFFDEVTGVEPLQFLLEHRGEEEDVCVSDSDSNDEDNWRNDYPDEEEYNYYDHGSSSEADDFFSDRMDDLTMDENGLIHLSFQRDVNLHGESYARYKQDILKSLDRHHEDDSASDISDCND